MSTCNRCSVRPPHAGRCLPCRDRERKAMHRASKADRKDVVRSRCPNCDRVCPVVWMPDGQCPTCRRGRGSEQGRRDHAATCVVGRCLTRRMPGMPWCPAHAIRFDRVPRIQGPRAETYAVRTRDPREGY
jgi:hypothetical protein